MTKEQYMKNLMCPTEKVDVVLDTDAYAEIDDQYAISYLIKSGEKLNVCGICAAPFLDDKSDSPADGMNKSYNEILKVLSLAKREDLNDRVFKGSLEFLKSETEFVDSPAARFIAEIAEKHTPEKPLYIVAIAAITNVASAILMNPQICENIVIVWLGGNSLHLNMCREFNMMQDVAAARIVFGCGAPFVQLPCAGVVDRFAISEFELRHWLSGKNELCDYLAENTITEVEKYAKGLPWTRVIWDVTAVAWLLNDNDRFMSSKLIPCPVPEYDNSYTETENGHLIRYVNNIKRDALFTDLFGKLTQEDS